MVCCRSKCWIGVFHELPFLCESLPPSTGPSPGFPRVGLPGTASGSIQRMHCRVRAESSGEGAERTRLPVVVAGQGRRAHWVTVVEVGPVRPGQARGEERLEGGARSQKGTRNWPTHKGPRVYEVGLPVVGAGVVANVPVSFGVEVLPSPHVSCDPPADRSAHPPALGFPTSQGSAAPPPHLH